MRNNIMHHQLQTLDSPSVITFPTERPQMLVPPSFIAQNAPTESCRCTTRIPWYHQNPAYTYRILFALTAWSSIMITSISQNAIHITTYCNCWGLHMLNIIDLPDFQCFVFPKTYHMQFRRNKTNIKCQNTLGCLDSYMCRGLRLWNSWNREVVYSWQVHGWRMENVEQSGPWSSLGKLSPHDYYAFFLVDIPGIKLSPHCYYVFFLVD